LGTRDARMIDVRLGVRQKGSMTRAAWVVRNGGAVDGLRRQRPLPHNDYLSIRGRSAIVRDRSTIIIGRTLTTKLAG
jgi:hypothetical protein